MRGRRLPSYLKPLTLTQTLPLVFQVSETTPAAFRRLLAFLYSDRLDLDDQVVIDVMRKAHEYDLTRAYNMCMRYCVRSVSYATCIPWLIRADAVQLEELRAVMLHHLKRNFRVVRAEAPETLAELRENPDLMLEVMRLV